MKIRFIIFIYIFIASLLFSTNTFADERLLDKVVAVVNSQVITQSELDQQMRVVRAQIRSSGMRMPSQAVLHQQVLNQLIDIALQKNIAQKANIRISKAQVDATIGKIAAQNNMSMAQLQRSIEAQGMSYSAYRHQIHDQMLISEVQHALVGPKVRVTPADVAAAKNSVQPAQPRQSDTTTLYHVVDILVLNSQNAQDLLSKIRSGGNPDSVLNNNPGVKISDLGFRKLSDLPGIFVKPVESLSPGQFSDLIQAPNGVHIISLIAVQGGGQAYRASRLTPQQIAYQKKFEEALQKWLQTLRSQSYIKIIN